MDIDWGDYPYVTSSGCTVAAAIANGVPAQRIRDIWGIAKAYETYVGMKNFQPEDPVFDMIREVGQEYGATTGRPRQCNWIKMSNLLKAIKINGVNRVVFNKADILKEVGVWKVYDENDFLVSFSNEQAMQHWVESRIPYDVKVIWSNSPERI